MNDPTRIAEFNADLKRGIAEAAFGRVLMKDYVNGFFMLFRLEAIEDVGTFDLKNRTWGNEDEWCARAVTSPRKWMFAIDRSVHVFHWKKVTVGRLGTFKGNIYPRMDGTIVNHKGAVLRDDAPTVTARVEAETDNSFVPDEKVEAPALDPEIAAELEKIKQVQPDKTVSAPPRMDNEGA